MLQVAGGLSPPWNLPETIRLCQETVVKYKELDNGGLPFKKPGTAPKMWQSCNGNHLQERHAPGLLYFEKNFEKKMNDFEGLVEKFSKKK